MSATKFHNKVVMKIVRTNYNAYVPHGIVPP